MEQVCPSAARDGARQQDRHHQQYARHNGAENVAIDNQHFVTAYPRAVAGAGCVPATTT